MPNWNKLAKEIANDIWKGGEQRVVLTYFIESSLQDKRFSINDPEILDHFDKLKDLVSRQIHHKIEDSTDKGITPRYRFSGIDTDILISQVDKHSDKVTKQMTCTIQQLSWRAFEHFCVHVLKISGLMKCKAMRGTKEEGIDLFGVLDLGLLTGASVWHGAHIKVLGQAKKSQVSEPLVRLFHQDMQSFLSGKGRAFELAPGWFKLSTMPVIGIMLTSDRFTRGAARWANCHNIVAKDVQQITEDLVKSTIPTPGLYKIDERIILKEKEFISYFTHLETGAG